MIKQLGYIGLETREPKEWHDLATNVLAFEAVANHPHGVANAQYFRIDDQHHRVAIYSSARNGLRHLGWLVDGHQELETCVERLERSGIKTTCEAPETAAERMVRELVSFEDPAGFRHELYWGPDSETLPFRPSRPIAGFVTAGQGLGHVVLCTSDQRHLVRFFQETLGFRLSDTMNLEGIEIAFLRCNERHHSLAVMTPGQGIESGQMHHVLFEMNSIDDVGHAYDLIQERQVPLILTLGRHVNDRMISFYFKSPSGVGIEIGTGARVVSDDSRWTPVHYNYAGIWGHKFVG